MLTFRDFLHARARARLPTCQSAQYGTNWKSFFKIVGVVSIVSNVGKVRSVDYIKTNLKKRIKQK